MFKKLQEQEKTIVNQKYFIIELSDFKENILKEYEKLKNSL